MFAANAGVRNQTAVVMANDRICREHYRLTLSLDQLAPAAPGQFVHVSPVVTAFDGYHEVDWTNRQVSDAWHDGCAAPYLRRAFSIAGLMRDLPHARVAINLIYREVGRATKWMVARRSGDAVSVLGPLGNRFPISADKPLAWMVAGGVGLPPMLWLARSLASAGRHAVAFCGAQSGDLLALTMRDTVKPDIHAEAATLCADEFATCDTPVIASTDDGSLGYHGHVGRALEAYHAANDVPPDDLVVYTCGPERMMRFVADFCRRHGIECHLCMERAMACGTGTCQSCVVPVRDDADPDGWRYRLCCTAGPVFHAKDIIWEPAASHPVS